MDNKMNNKLDSKLKDIKIKSGRYIPKELSTQYPFNSMEVDTMFEMPYDRNILTLLYARRKSYCSKNKMVFIIQCSEVNNYIKCWRIE